jgi:iron complex transport system substrate-binding protein
MRRFLHIEQHRRRRRNRCLAVIAATIIAAVAMTVTATGTTPASAKPERIVSLNLCTDQLVMLLADSERIASVSHLAATPRVSVMAEEAIALHLNHGLAEEILPFNPDLIIAGSFTTRPTVFLLRRLGFPVVEVPVASSLDDIRSNIRFIAEAIGEPARGDALIAAFDDKLPPRPAAPAASRPLAVLYWANGYTSGKGTLANAAVEAAGFRTLGTELGLTGTSKLPLETLLASNADILVLGLERDEPALAMEIFRHPALKRAFAARPTIRIPDHYWACGTPFIADAIALLSAALESERNNRHGEIGKK